MSFFKGCHRTDDDNDSFLVMIPKFSQISEISDQKIKGEMMMNFKIGCLRSWGRYDYDCEKQGKPWLRKRKLFMIVNTVNESKI